MFFTRTSFYTGIFWHWVSFKHRSFYTQILLRRHVLTQEHMHTEGFFTQIFLQSRSVFARILLHRDAFTHTGAFRLGRFQAEELLHGRGWKHNLGEGSNDLESSFHPYPFWRWNTNDAFTERSSTHKCFYTGQGLHTEMVSHRGMILQRDASTHECSYTEMLSTQKCLDTNIFTQMILYRQTFRRRCLYTEMLLHTGAFTRCSYAPKG